jgi:hypothetical protein
VVGNYAYVASRDSNALEIVEFTTSTPNGYRLNDVSVLTTNTANTSLLLGAGMPGASIGIGTESPTARLTVAGTSTSGAAAAGSVTDSTGKSLLSVNNAGNAAVSGSFTVGGDATVQGSTTLQGAVTINAPVTVKTVLRIPPSGDLGMGTFTTGTNPAN